MNITYKVALVNNYIVITSDDLPDFLGVQGAAKDVIIKPTKEDAERFEFWGLDDSPTMWGELNLNQILDSTGTPFLLADWITFYTTNTGQYGLSASSSGGATEVTLSALNDKVPTIGQKTMALSLPVAISSNQSPIPVTQSGTFTVMPGNTANTTPWSVVQYLPVVLTTGDVGAKIASGNGNTMNNTLAKGLNIVFNIGTVTGTTPTCVFKIQGSSDVGSTWYDVPNAATATLVATGVYGIQIYPGISTVVATTTTGTISQVNAVLPRTWRVVWTIGGTTPSFTITNIQVSYIP